MAVAAEMGWLAREPERRFDPRRLDPRAAIRRQPRLSVRRRRARPPSIGASSCADVSPPMRSVRDYHDVVLAQGRAVAAALEAAQPER